MTYKVKVLSKVDPRKLERQLPDGGKAWGDCTFVFDPREKQYDWLVVYEDFALPDDGGRGRRGEKLACDAAHTLLVTTEPSSIKTYGSAYVNQFAHVLTSQPEWALPHNHRIFSQPALRWFYGVGKNHVVTLDQMRASMPSKSKVISTVCSSKRQKRTLHDRRYQFTQRLKAALPELDVFGHGVKPMDDKAEALDAYRYHVAIENFVGEHHWTEKLSDAFLGHTLPFYYGCPNAARYFPEQSYIPIDIFEFESARQAIDRAIRDNEYEKRLPDISEARRRVIDQYNLFSVVSRIVARHHDDRSFLPKGHDGTIYPRKTITRNGCVKATLFLCEKVRMQLNHRFAKR